ncbi:MAG: YSC84-related protein [Betaproteobacteria bacterium]|nr:YSC84-related protein [Betaproteobacteria bacterium]
MNTSRAAPLFYLCLVLVLLAVGVPARAESRADLDRASQGALDRLYRINPAARAIGNAAHAVLVFPNIVKAGLVFGGSYGEGELIVNGHVDGYYNSVSASWGLQAGAQTYGYAVFLMNDNAVNYLHQTHGWEIGVGPTVVLVNDGIARNLSTSTLKDDAYAFIFGQQGLMAGLNIEGTKVTRIQP